MYQTFVSASNFSVSTCFEYSLSTRLWWFEITELYNRPMYFFISLQVIWRSWKISLRIEFKGAAPGENKMTHDDFLHDARMQRKVSITSLCHKILSLHHLLYLFWCRCTWFCWGSWAGVYYPSLEQVGVVFGQQILQYTQALCQGNFDYLERLPNDLLLQILAFLELKDVAQLAQTTKRFHKVSLCFKNPKGQFPRYKCNLLLD